MPKISIIVPVYKVELYLCRCVDSILAQTFTDFELILVDDGSPDNCPAICDKYAEKDSRIHVIHKENGGVSSARNAGIDWVLYHSGSEWICFVDSDDFVSPVYLEKLYDDTVDISICGHYYSNADGVVTDENRSAFCGVYEVTPENMNRWHKGGLLYSVCRGIFRASIIHSANLKFHTKTSYGEDSIFMFEYVFKCKNVRFVEDLLYYYVRYGGGTITTTVSAKTIKSLDYTNTYLVNWFKENHLIIENHEDSYFYTLLEQLTGTVQSTEMSWRSKYRMCRLIWKTNIFKKNRRAWFKNYSRKSKLLFFAPTPLFFWGYQLLKKMKRKSK